MLSFVADVFGVGFTPTVEICFGGQSGTTLTTIEQPTEQILLLHFALGKGLVGESPLLSSFPSVGVNNRRYGNLDPLTWINRYSCLLPIHKELAFVDGILDRLRDPARYPPSTVSSKIAFSIQRVGNLIHRDAFLSVKAENLSDHFSF